MFGYIKTHAPELRVREQEYYRGIYCGLCRSLGKCTGQCSRLTLSYDFAFMAAVRMALEQKAPTFKPRRCVAHPLKKRAMAEPDEILSMCAYASGILGYYKVQDDRTDERGGKRARATILSPYMKKLRRRAVKRGYAELDARVGAAMDELARLEAARPLSVDEPAELFGALMSDILAWGLDANEARIARELGRHVGRWIYIVDAADDFEEDRKRRRYNPFDCLWQGGEMTDARREQIRIALICELQEMERAVDLLELDGDTYRDLFGIISNVMYFGMPHAADKVLYGDSSCTKAKRESAAVHD